MDESHVECSKGSPIIARAPSAARVQRAALKLRVREATMVVMEELPVVARLRLQESESSRSCSQAAAVRRSRAE